ncbi:DUF6265 family protein [Marinicella sp. W31]|uniref:DUF6265 family protein n=1 Tax=Marinicella sp. W31 TaxID=3023713 RepID=UPI00375802F6
MRYVFIMLLILSTTLYAQEKRTEHTYQLTDKAAQPQATLEDVSWLVGSWKGEAFGSQMEEVWNPPSAGSMVGMFKLYNDKGVSFYELLLIKEENNSLNLKVKHFSADFVAWEEKKDYINFPLAKIEKDAIHFAGLSFYRTDDDHFTGYIVMKSSDGSIREEKLTYQRVVD